MTATQPTLADVRRFNELHDANPDPVTLPRVTREFVLAGDAIFTVETPDHQHYTYRVEYQPAGERWPQAWFVKILTGPDNGSDYSYLGKLDDFTGQMKTTAKSAMPADAFPVRLLNRILARIWGNDHAAFEQFGYRVHHEGKCGRCARRLTTPESVTLGFGPECAKLLGY